MTKPAMSARGIAAGAALLVAVLTGVAVDSLKLQLLQEREEKRIHRQGEAAVTALREVALSGVRSLELILSARSAGGDRDPWDSALIGVALLDRPWIMAVDIRSGNVLDRYARGSMLGLLEGHDLGSLSSVTRGVGLPEGACRDGGDLDWLEGAALGQADSSRVLAVCARSGPQQPGLVAVYIDHDQLLRAPLVARALQGLAHASGLDAPPDELPRMIGNLPRAGAVSLPLTTEADAPALWLAVPDLRSYPSALARARWTGLLAALLVGCLVLAVNELRLQRRRLRAQDVALLERDQAAGVAAALHRYFGESNASAGWVGPVASLVPEYSVGLTGVLRLPDDAGSAIDALDERPGASLPEVVQTRLRTLQNPGDSTDMHFECLDHTGERRWFRLHARVDAVAPGPALRLFVGLEDVSSVRRIERELSRVQTAHAILRNAVDEHALVIVTDTDGRMIEFNDRVCEVSGYPRDELMHQPIRRLGSGAHPRGFWQRFWLSISTAKVWRGVICNRRRDGSLFWLQTCVVPQLGDDGRIECYHQVSTDITEIRAARENLDRLQRQLVHAQKMEAIGQLTGGIAHDFNNILASVLGYARLGLQRCEAGEADRLQGYFQQIERAGERAATLVAKMAAFARVDPPRSHAFDLDAGLDESLDLLRPLFPASIMLRIVRGLRGAWVSFDSAQFQQVLVNVCLNARDAMPDGGELKIETAREVVHGSECSSCHDVVRGQYVCVRVSDTGCGVPQHIQRRVFDPFFTTKDVGKGSGMGLAMVHGLLHAAGGHIIVSSVEGRGTVVELLFPPDPGEADSEPAPAPTLRPQRHTLAGIGIAVVDDEVDVAQVIAALVRGWGGQVREYHDASALLGDMRSGAFAPDLVLSDVTMPGLHGVDLLRILRREYGNLPVIAVSGYSEIVGHDNHQNLGFDAYLQKPVDFGDLHACCLRLAGRAAPDAEGE